MARPQQVVGDRNCVLHKLSDSRDCGANANQIEHGQPARTRLDRRERSGARACCSRRSTRMATTKAFRPIHVRPSRCRGRRSFLENQMAYHHEPSSPKGSISLAASKRTEKSRLMVKSMVTSAALT